MWAEGGTRLDFDGFVRDYRPRLTAVLPAGADAEDIAQETLCRALPRITEFTSAPGLFGWCRVVGRRMAWADAASVYRRRVTLHPDMAELADVFSDPDADPERMVLAKEEREALLAALAALPARQRRALVARVLEGRSVGQIAADLDLSRVAVRQLLRRAHDGLRREYQCRLGGVAVPLWVRCRDWLRERVPGRDASSVPAPAGAAGIAQVGPVGGALAVTTLVVGLVAPPVGHAGPRTTPGGDDDGRAPRRGVTVPVAATALDPGTVSGPAAPSRPDRRRSLHGPVWLARPVPVLSTSPRGGACVGETCVGDTEYGDRVCLDGELPLVGQPCSSQEVVGTCDVVWRLPAGAFTCERRSEPKVPLPSPAPAGEENPL